MIKRYCRKCWYNLRGTSSHCPECGHPFNADDCRTFRICNRKSFWIRRFCYITSVLFCLISIASSLSWIYLPKLAPDFVLDHSPFLAPAMKATMYSERRENDFFYHRFVKRDWGRDIWPDIIEFMEEGDSEQKSAAIGMTVYYLELDQLDPPLAYRLQPHRALFKQMLQDEDDLVRSWAEEFLKLSSSDTLSNGQAAIDDN